MNKTNLLKKLDYNPNNHGRYNGANICDLGTQSSKWKRQIFDVIEKNNIKVPSLKKEAASVTIATSMSLMDTRS